MSFTWFTSQTYRWPDLPDKYVAGQVDATVDLVNLVVVTVARSRDYAEKNKMSDSKGSPLFIDRSAVVTYIFQMVKVSYLVFCKLFHSSKKIVVMKNVIF